MFTIYKQGADGQALKKYRIVKNSEVIKVGDVITDEGTGAADVDAVTEAILGVVTAIVTKNGVNADAVGANVSGYVAATKTLTAENDNVTDKQYYVEYIPVTAETLLLGKLDAAKGTTTGSNLAGYFLASTTGDASLLDESSASTTITNTQFVIENPYPTVGSRKDADRLVVVRVHNRMFE